MSNTMRWIEEFDLSTDYWLGCDNKTLGGIIELGKILDAIQHIKREDLDLSSKAVSKVAEELVNSPFLPTIKMIIRYHDENERVNRSGDES